VGDGESTGTHLVDPSGMAQDGGVLYPRVAVDLFMFWRIQVRVDMCRSGTCICRVVRKPQLGLINLNRRAPRLWRLDPLTIHRS
jgi:hypothetical protein